MAGSGALKNAILSAYDTLIEALTSAVEDGNVGSVLCDPFPSGCFRIDPADKNIALLDTKLHLYAFEKHDLSVLAQIRETINRDSGALLKSNVLVCYFRIKDKIATHLHSVHYDYDGEQDYHPVFHAQLCSDRVALTDKDKASLNFEFELSNSQPTCYRESRIPTSDMTFPSVLLCLAADSVRGESFKKMLDSVVEHQEKLPHPGFVSTSGSIQAKPAHLRSSHWFAHHHIRKKGDKED